MTIIQHEEHDVRIPESVSDLAAFRRWAASDDFPEYGRFAYLDGGLWVDPSTERAGHNQIKTEVSNVVGPLAKGQGLGRFWGDGIEDAEESLEVVGVPDMVLEVISRSSFKKDTVVLRKLYARAGVREYWVADSRAHHFSFEILHRRGAGYASAAADRGGWVESRVFGRAFRLLRETDPVGMPEFRFEMK